MLNLNFKAQTSQLVFNCLIVFAEDTTDDTFIQNDDIFILGVLFFVIAYNNGNLTIPSTLPLADPARGFRHLQHFHLHGSRPQR